MKTNIISLFFFVFSCITMGQKTYETDAIPASGGDIQITFIGHGTLMLTYKGTVIHVDPWSRLADYDALPRADIVLITHAHQDHLDTVALRKVRKPGTQLYVTAQVFEILKEGVIMKNGDRRESGSIVIEAVPAYNTTAGRENFHPRRRDNGYVLTLGGKRIYIAGDTENIPEMARLKNIDVAFLPMNQPYTMTPEQVAEAAKSFLPKILYPYHFGDTDVSKLTTLMKGVEGVEVRIRSMK